MIAWGATPSPVKMSSCSTPIVPSSVWVVIGAPEVDGARIEERRETEVAQLEHAVDAPLRIFAAGGTVSGRFRFPARPADHEVLVHERGAQLARLDRPRDRLYLLHARHESAVEPPQSRCPVR